MNDKYAMVICPISLLEEFSTRHHLVLTHYYKEYPVYKDFYKRRRSEGDFIIQDNGAAELKKSLQVHDLIEVAKDLQPNVIVAPDVIYSKNDTLNLTEAFLRDYASGLHELGIEVMGVPQGQTPEEWLECYTVFNNDSRIDWLGISMFHNPTFGDRDSILKTIAPTVSRPCHLLGLWNNPLDLLEERKYDFVKSVDTAKPIEFGLEGLLLDDWAGHRHVDDDWYFTLGRTLRGGFEDKLVSWEKEIVAKNVSDYIALFNEGKYSHRRRG